MSDSKLVDTVKDWVTSLRDDVETIKRVVESGSVDADARKFAATALNYLVTRMDLVPDWEESIGVIDDVMVLRTCVSLAQDHDVDAGLDSQTLVEVGRLGNQAAQMSDLLGSELCAKFRKFCARQSEIAVRNRTPEAIVSDDKERARLYAEVDDDLLRMPAAPFTDPKSVERQYLSYLKNKLA